MGVRQFQQIGGASVTVWREARRIKAQELECTLSAEAKDIIDAADSGDWKTYTELMGGTNCKRADRPIRPLMIQRKSLNKYGEFLEQLKGLLVHGLPIETRTHNWIIQPVGTAEARRSNAENQTDTENFAGERSNSATWTCVNNCTEDLKHYENLMGI